MTTRLDKFLCDNSELTRSLAKKAISKGRVKVNEQVITKPATKIHSTDSVFFNKQTVKVIGNRYIMLNKPADYICSTIDEQYPSVLRLIDIEKPDGLHIAGRLDADTTGLVLITDDGQWSHRISSPNRYCTKTYQVELAEAIDDSAIEQFKQGIQLHGEANLTRSATLNIIGPKQVTVTISEGKYHQVKRMFAAIGNKVIKLHRQQIGQIELDEQLTEGQWRFLTPEQVASFNPE